MIIVTIFPIVGFPSLIFVEARCELHGDKLSSRQSFNLKLNFLFN